MLRHTFIHLPGIGTHRERTLWKQGILDWDRFLEATEDGVLRQGIYESATPLVRQSLDAVAAGNAGFFHGSHWQVQHRSAGSTYNGNFLPTLYLAYSMNLVVSNIARHFGPRTKRVPTFEEFCRAASSRPTPSASMTARLHTLPV